jgi:hypothetical protein
MASIHQGRAAFSITIRNTDGNCTLLCGSEYLRNEGEVLAPDAGRDPLQCCGRIPGSGFYHSETMIGKSALAGIVTRGSIILVDFMNWHTTRETAL